MFGCGENNEDVISYWNEEKQVTYTHHLPRAIVSVLHKSWLCLAYEINTIPLSRPSKMSRNQTKG